ncbi:MAG TPA: cysteine desulfurase family protein [Gemmatimonadaceae bacterium]|nr:cysteine desulfurase family protein [Gemmatimonadaceae bacterium]
MTQAPIYLDHAATTPVRDEVFEAMRPFFGPRFGNPSSTHRWGREARAALDEARERVARCLGAQVDEIVFTSGGTEADNLAVLGGWRILRERGRNAIVTTPIEHKAVLGSVHQAATEGAEERFFKITRDGVVDLTSARDLIDDQTALVTVMWVNNETGAVQPVAELCAIAKERGAVFHTDAVQAFGHVEVDVRKIAFDLLSVSGHKLGAPKGIGAMFLRRGTPLTPLFFGGTQDRGRRPGTENVAMAVGLATAMELTLAELDAECARTRALRESLERAITAKIPDVVIHARGAERAPHVMCISIPGTDSESMLMALDLKGIACSGGSACQSGSVGASHVLSAMGVAPDLVAAQLRLSLGSLSNEEDIQRVAEILPALAAKARGVAVG